MLLMVNMLQLFHRVLSALSDKYIKCFFLSLLRDFSDKKMKRFFLSVLRDLSDKYIKVFFFMYFVISYVIEKFYYLLYKKDNC